MSATKQKSRPSNPFTAPRAPAPLRETSPPADPADLLDTTDASPPPAPPAAETILVNEDRAVLSLPVGELPDQGYLRKFHNVDCRLSDKEHATAFQKLFYALNQGNYRLHCGRHIDTAADVVKYFLEQYAQSLATPAVQSPA